MAAPRRTPTEKQKNWRDAIDTSRLINKLRDHTDGKCEMSQTQLKACELLLSRTVPTLSAVEQTTISHVDAMTEAELLDKLRALVAANPELIQAIQTPIITPVTPDTEQQVTH